MATMLSAPVAASELETSSDLLSALSTSSHSFLQPTVGLHTAAINAAKRLLDPLALDISHAQESRKQENRKKRKRSDLEPDASRALRVGEVYTEGFGVNQIWEQARRILDATNAELERDLKQAAASPGVDKKMAEFNGEAGKPSNVRMVRFAEDGFEVDSEDESKDEEMVGEEGEDLAEDGEIEEEDEEFADGPDGGLNAEDVGAMSEEEGESDLDYQQPQTYKPDPNNLNDGFFSIDDFNKQSQFLEQTDARGDDDNPSDEDEIDWDADPLTMNFSKSKSSRLTDGNPGEEDDDEADEGPGFGNADLSAPFSDSEDEEDLDGDNDMSNGMAGLDNTNEVRYADFFEPPPQKPSKTKRMRALPKTQPPPRPAVSTQMEEDMEADIERAISDVRRDLLDSEDEEPSASDSETGAARPSKQAKANMSTHEKQRASIAAEIRELEALNVSKRDWTLAGEARAADRPINSLIEEDLEFERAGKPIPVITAEVSSSIEDLIKRRIVARDFDEIIRRRPEGAASSDTRRGRAADIELDDQKSKAGLAELYEADRTGAHAGARSKSLKKQHDDIGRLWREVSAQLDVLSNLHFRPKRPAAEVKVVGDKPTISMEDARPGGGEEERSMLAPQEVYRPGEAGKAAGEVMTAGGMARAKEEMSREEKLRRRRREKERGKKAKGSEAQKQVQIAGPGKDRKKGKGEEKRDILSELKRGGVQVIGKRGDLEDLGKKTNKGNMKAMEGARNVKL